MSLSPAKMPKLSDKLEANGKITSEKLQEELEALQEDFEKPKKKKK